MEIQNPLIYDLDYDTVLPLVALDKDRIVASAALKFNPVGWTRHQAELPNRLSDAFAGPVPCALTSVRHRRQTDCYGISPYIGMPSSMHTNAGICVPSLLHSNWG